MGSLSRYFHTVRYLRAAQVAARVRLRLYRPKLNLREPPPVRPRTAPYAAPVAPQASLIAPQTIRLLNVERSCVTARDWRPPGVEKLWVYHLHYFDDLNAQDAPARLTWHKSLLERWVEQNPPAEGEGWEPYPLSRRIVNWIKWTASGHVLPAVCHASLAVQTRWLEQRLEYHILGNHLLANAQALVHAGLYFSGPEADAWYGRGMQILSRELREQILPDGGHFERSPMYHAAVLEALLDLINVLRAYARAAPAGWPQIIARMRRWLEVMSHPDGEIAFFNDAAFDMAPNSAALTAYAERLGFGCPCDALEPLTLLTASGYVRGLSGPAYLLCDCAALGPDYLPGHGHADTLSFELSLGRQRMLVNSGTSQYGTDAERQRQRGTAAHNTVVVGATDSSEVWAGFRVARRARARLLAARATGAGLLIAGAHDGYGRITHGGEHERQWLLSERSLEIEDRLGGSCSSAEAMFHLHPDVSARIDSEREVRLTVANGMLARMSFDGALQVILRHGSWHPRFGVTVPNTLVAVRFAGASLKTRVSWSDR